MQIIEGFLKDENLKCGAKNSPGFIRGCSKSLHTCLQNRLKQRHVPSTRLGISSGKLLKNAGVFTKMPRAFKIFKIKYAP